MSTRWSKRIYVKTKSKVKKVKNKFMAFVALGNFWKMAQNSKPGLKNLLLCTITSKVHLKGLSSVSKSYKNTLRQIKLTKVQPHTGAHI